MSFKDDLRNYNYDFYITNDIEKLNDIIRKLKKLIHDGFLDQENQINAKGLLVRCSVKKDLYKLNGFNYSLELINTTISGFNAYKSYLADDSSSFDKTIIGIDNAIDLLCHLAPFIELFDKVQKLLYNSSNVTLSKEEYAHYANVIEKIYDDLEQLIVKPIFNEKVKCIDLKKELLDRFELLYDDVKKNIDMIVTANDTAFLDNYTINIYDTIRYNVNFYPLLGIKEKNLANMLVLLSPYLEELYLALYAHSRNNGTPLYLVDSNVFASKTKEQIDDIFNLFIKYESDIAIKDLVLLNDNTLNMVIDKMAEFTKNNRYAFVLDTTGSNKLYKLIQNYLDKSQAYDILDVSSVYLTLPSYDDTVSLFEDENMISSTDDNIRKTVKNKLQYLGYSGLNIVYEAFKNNEAYMNLALRISKDNDNELLKRYLSELTISTNLIDPSWDLFVDSYTGMNNNIIPSIEIDYDEIKAFNPYNLKLILDSQYYLYEKCGLMLQYVLLHGEDTSSWNLLEKQEKIDRITLASKLLYKMLRIEYEPVIVVEDELDNKFAGGYCGKGGREVHYKYNSVANDFEYTHHVIAHECHHSFQYWATSTPYCGWWFKEFGLTPGMIRQWKNDQDNYINLETFDRKTKKFKAYYQQVIECESNAFADDCKHAVSLLWKEFDFK